MNSQELRALQEAYSQVYELDEAAIYKRGGKGQTTETPLQIYGKSATAREKKKLHNIPKGRIGANEVGDYDRGSGNAAKRRAAALTKPEAKKFPNRLTRSDGQGIKDSYEYDLYDIILSHLLDEGYADTEQAAEVIMVNMSEDWRESIMEVSDRKVAAVGRRRQANVDRAMDSDEYISDKPGATQKLATAVSQKTRFDNLNKKRERRGG